MKKILLIVPAILLSLNALAQVDVNGNQIDTTDIYKDRADSLSGTVFTARQNGTYISKFKDARVETISAAGLCKMACCNLAESFENSASVTVGYSDAVTGARQIRLLGLSGTYTQMLDENRPVMRGLSAPFGLSYVPGQWLESIQIAKGAASVINGVESMTGQINMEHRKPTDERPLFLNFAIMDDTKMDFNIASSLQIDENWSTVLLGHVSGNAMGMDGNRDGFLDDPMQLQFNISNRWLYYTPDGIQVRFGVRAIRDSRRGGECVMKGKNYMTAGYDPDEFESSMGATPWGSRILNQSIDGYLKIGYPLDEDGCNSIALVMDYNYQNMNSHFGSTRYLAGQHSGWANLLYQFEAGESHKFTVGASTMLDFYNEDFFRKIGFSGLIPDAVFNGRTTLATAGLFGEYTYKYEDKLSLITGLRGEWYKPAIEGIKPIKNFRISPRMTLRYTPVEQIVLRANAGRGLRYSNPIIDNIGVLSTSRVFQGNFDDHILEDSWIFGGNATFYFPLGASDNAYVSVDYFRTQFVEQAVVDYENPAHTNSIDFYSLSSISNGRSFTDTYQLDFSCEPVERFTVTLTGRYSNAKMTLANRGLVEKPMTSSYKAVLNLQYALPLNKWIFDFTASLNGSSRVYEFMYNSQEAFNAAGPAKEIHQIKPHHGGFYSTPYPLLYAQVTKRFKGVDLYIGGENLTNFRQKQLVSGTKVDLSDPNSRLNPNLADFDASCVWGPIMGIKVYAGVRFTLWKTEK